jgi:PAS domain S-box-containing protein
MERAFELVSNTADGVFAVDSRQRIVMWNDAAREMLGYEQGDVLGRHCFGVLGGRDADGLRICRKDCDAFTSSLRAELSATRDYRVRRRDGTSVWVNMTTLHLPSRWQQLSVLVHIFRDSSRVKLLETLLEQDLRKLAGPIESQEAELPGKVEKLTPREAELLQLLAAGVSTKGMCERLGVSEATVRTHVQHLIAKLGVHSRLEAVTLAIRHNML